jgi:hypothetical protein
MSKIVNGLKKAARRVVDDENFRDGLATVVGAVVGILIAVIRRR